MAENALMSRGEAAGKKRTVLSAVLILLVMPLTIFLGERFGQNRFMLVSVLLLFYTMAPFFMIFEKRKPKAREIVLIAMMSALTVCVHMFFHMTLPLQAGTALIIISGVSLGPEAGFLIGAISRFVCNFYMGQGPWTPWQMFSWGILGFLAGLAFNKIDLDQLKSRHFKMIMGPVLCIIFAALAAYVCYQFWPGKDRTFFGWRLYVACHGSAAAKKAVAGGQHHSYPVYLFHHFHYLWRTDEYLRSGDCSGRTGQRGSDH